MIIEITILNVIHKAQDYRQHPNGILLNRDVVYGKHKHIKLIYFIPSITMRQSNKITNNCIIFAVLFIGLVLPFPIDTVNSTVKKVSPAERQEIFKKFMELTKGYHSITATVHQEKQLVTVLSPLGVFISNSSGNPVSSS